MSTTWIGILYGVATLVLMLSGMPIAFALGTVAVTFMYFFMPASSLDTVTQNVYEEMSGITLLSLVLVAVVYRVWRPRDLAPILAGTLRESTMLMFIIGMSLLYSYVMSYLHISQSAAEYIVALHLSKWALLVMILLLVLGLGFFLPPVSIILMTAPIILPPLRAAGFDLIWFGVIMTVVMEMGLIHPPVGLNIFVIKNIAPGVPLGQIVRGVLPFILLMMLTIVLLCLFPGLSLGLTRLAR